eukprot:6485233-Amphidinium_carterae.1
MGRKEVGKQSAKLLRRANTKANCLFRRVLEIAKKGKSFVVFGKSRNLAWNLTLAKQLLGFPSAHVVDAWICLHSTGGQHFCIKCCHNVPGLSEVLWGLSCSCTTWRDAQTDLFLPPEWVSAVTDYLAKQFASTVRPERGEAEELQMIRASLGTSTTRLADQEIKEAAARKILDWAATMKPGYERAHRHSLIRHADLRGSDVKLTTQELVQATMQEVPYPAYKWLWELQP